MMVCTMYKENIERGRVRKKWYGLRTSQGIHNGINVNQYEFSTVDDVTKTELKAKLEGEGVKIQENLPTS